MSVLFNLLLRRILSLVPALLSRLLSLHAVRAGMAAIDALAIAAFLIKSLLLFCIASILIYFLYYLIEIIDRPAYLREIIFPICLVFDREVPFEVLPFQFFHHPSHVEYAFSPYHVFEALLFSLRRDVFEVQRDDSSLELPQGRDG